MLPSFEQLILDLTPRYGPGEARSIARIVFEDVFGARKPAQKILDAVEQETYGNIRQRLMCGEPVQYVLGQADFFGLKFDVTLDVLIPRQETEELVAWVLDWLKSRNLQTPAVLDIGLGSGCIAVALKARRRDIQLFGLEKSPHALAVAARNAGRILGTGNWVFEVGDILEESSWSGFPMLDVIVSNPPYIPRQEQHLMPEHVVAFEPAMALFVDDADPLLFYQRIAVFAQHKLKPGGALFFECNEFNASTVAQRLLALGFPNVELRKDLSGKDRMLLAINP